MLSSSKTSIGKASQPKPTPGVAPAKIPATSVKKLKLSYCKKKPYYLLCFPVMVT